MKHGMFFLVDSKKAWVNLARVESVYRVGENWTLKLVSGSEYQLTEGEYLQLADMMRGIEPQNKE